MSELLGLPLQTFHGPDLCPHHGDKHRGPFPGDRDLTSYHPRVCCSGGYIRTKTRVAGHRLRVFGGPGPILGHPGEFLEAIETSVRQKDGRDKPGRRFAWTLCEELNLVSGQGREFVFMLCKLDLVGCGLGKSRNHMISD